MVCGQRVCKLFYKTLKPITQLSVNNPLICNKLYFNNKIYDFGKVKLIFATNVSVKEKIALGIHDNQIYKYKFVSKNNVYVFERYEVIHNYKAVSEDPMLIKYLQRLIGHLPEKYPVNLVAKFVDPIKYIPKVFGEGLLVLFDGTLVASRNFLGAGLRTLLKGKRIGFDRSAFSDEEWFMIELFCKTYNLILDNQYCEYIAADTINTKFAENPEHVMILKSRKNIEGYFRSSNGPGCSIYINHKNFAPDNIIPERLLCGFDELKAFYGTDIIPERIISRCLDYAVKRNRCGMGFKVCEYAIEHKVITEMIVRYTYLIYYETFQSKEDAEEVVVNHLDYFKPTKEIWKVGWEKYTAPMKKLLSLLF